MNCQDAQEFISAVYDGEDVTQEAAHHIGACAVCRQVLDSYSRIGNELRLLAARASRAPGEVPPSLLEKASRAKTNTGFFRRKMLVPRFAVAVAAGLVLTLSAGLITLRGQSSKPLWFSFQMNLDGAPAGKHGGHPTQAVQAGYDDVWAWNNGPNGVTGTHLAVLSVQENQVRLAIRARHYQDFTAASHLKEDNNLSGHEYTLTPGQSLQIPIEGGTALVLQGRVLDHQPKMLFGGIPLEPDDDEIVATSPVLLAGNKVLIDLKGANAINSGPDAQIALYAPGTGLLKFGLQPFSGSTQATAEWGRLDFTWNGQQYSVLTQSPITGGTQPHTVSVSLNPDAKPGATELQNGFLGTDNSQHPVH